MMVANLSQQYHIAAPSPNLAFGKISEFSVEYLKVMRAYSKGEHVTNGAKLLNHESDDFLTQKREFLKKVARSEYNRGIGHEEQISQIKRASIALLETRLYMGHPLLIHVNEDVLVEKEDHFVDAIDESEKGLLSFLVGSIEASSRAMINDDKLRPEFIPALSDVNKIIHSLVNLDLSWISNVVRRRVFYLRASREKKELSLRYLFLDLSTLLLHLSFLPQIDNLARQGLEEFAYEMRDECVRTSSSEFYKYYNGFRKDFREIAWTFKYYNPSPRKNTRSLAQ